MPRTTNFSHSWAGADNSHLALQFPQRLHLLSGEDWPEVSYLLKKRRLNFSELSDLVYTQPWHSGHG